MQSSKANGTRVQLPSGIRNWADGNRDESPVAIGKAPRQMAIGTRVQLPESIPTLLSLKSGGVANHARYCNHKRKHNIRERNIQKWTINMSRKYLQTDHAGNMRLIAETYIPNSRHTKWRTNPGPFQIISEVFRK